MLARLAPLEGQNLPSPSPLSADQVLCMVLAAHSPCPSVRVRRCSRKSVARSRLAQPTIAEFCVHVWVQVHTSSYPAPCTPQHRWQVEVHDPKQVSAIQYILPSRRPMRRCVPSPPPARGFASHLGDCNGDSNGHGARPSPRLQCIDRQSIIGNPS